MAVELKNFTAIFGYEGVNINELWVNLNHLCTVRLLIELTTIMQTNHLGYWQLIFLWQYTITDIKGSIEKRTVSVCWYRTVSEKTRLGNQLYSSGLFDTRKEVCQTVLMKAYQIPYHQKFSYKSYLNLHPWVCVLQCLSFSFWQTVFVWHRPFYIFLLNTALNRRI